MRPVISSGETWHWWGSGPLGSHDKLSCFSFFFEKLVQEQFLASGRLCCSFPFGALTGMGYGILLMEEIPNNHLGCIKPCK